MTEKFKQIHHLQYRNDNAKCYLKCRFVLLVCYYSIAFTEVLLSLHYGSVVVS